MKTWLILTGSGIFLRGRYKGRRMEAVKYCKDHYLLKGYKVIEDKGEVKCH